jgi:small subunit ribosomal protein S18
MAKFGGRGGGGPGGRERRERKESFQSFNRPKVKVARVSASSKVYIDYKDTESLRKMVSANGKILARKRTGASAMEQRMVARAVKRARYMALMPYVSTGM